jgi:hypothetical protein
MNTLDLFFDAPDRAQPAPWPAVVRTVPMDRQLRSEARLRAEARALAERWGCSLDEALVRVRREWGAR